MIKVLVPVSGGKDSQACIKLAIDEYGSEQVLGLFCDTRFEHPSTYEHVQKIADMYSVKIETINAGDVESLVLHYKRFPGGGARFCTDELKIQPTIKYAKELAKTNGGFEIWYGMRTDESGERARRYENVIGDEVYDPHDYMSKYPKYLGKMGVKVRLPIVDWSRAQVLDFLCGDENPLYAAGFDRVGCFPCLASGDVNKERAFGFDEFGESQKQKVIWLESQIGKSIWTSKGGSQRNNPDQICMFCQI